MFFKDFKKRGGSMKKVSGLLLMVFLVAIVGCTKEKPYEFVPHKEAISKDVFSKEDFGDLKAEEIQKLSPEEKKQYLTPRIAVMSYGQATRTASASMPYFQGRTKLVEFDVGRDYLEVRELEKDPRFASNPTNSRAIMRIPVRHVAYECDKDAYGECKNREIETDKVHWSERPYIVMDFERTEFLDADELPVEITNLISGCYIEKSQKVIGLELEKGVFNLELQKSFLVDLRNPSCWGEISDFENLFESLNFDVRYMYSIIRTDQLSSKDYKAVEYKREDEGTFGFFDTRNRVLDVDNNEVENTDKVFLNRWNPAKKVIPYYLSAEFSKPQNDYVLAATLQAVQNINNGLTQANAGIQIQLLPADKTKKVGDLRNNMIVLVEDPLASRIIGYGPSVANPSTGEIVNARTVMYLGTIRGIVKKTYEDMREEILAERRESLKKMGTRNAGNILALRKSIGHFASAKSLIAPIHRDSLEPVASGKADSIQRALAKYQRLESKSLLARESKYIDKRIDLLSRHNIYPEELFNAEYALQSAGIDKTLENNLKPWDELTSGEKEEIIRTVLPHIWIPTLVHELGHNLGLRHNFAGSEDKANFYSPEELGKMGIAHAIPYSSMMEYSYKTTNELPTLGKYDIAALRFAYSREVETAGGELVKVETNLEDTVKALTAQGQKLKDYKYCTDEHASANPNCNRFDEGTSLTEIANHLVNAYEHNYKRLNKRNSRRNFSSFQEGSYLGRIQGNFYDLRLMYELYERVKNDFGVSEGHELWKKEPFLKDIYDASTIAGQFFLTALLTPDVNCAIAMDQEPSIPVAVIPIRNLDESATSCYHPGIDQALKYLGEANGGLNLVIAGEGGKSFRTRKDSLNQNPYQDQIDVQGVWIDKLMAMEFLFARQLGSGLFDKHTQNFLDHGAVAPHAEGILAAILLGRGAVQVPFRDADGFPVKFTGEQGEETNLLPVSIEFGLDHYIDVPEVGGLTKFFGLPNEQTTFQRQLVTSLSNLIPTKINSSSSKRFLEVFSVYKDKPRKEKVLSARVGSDEYFAIPENKVAASAIQSLGYAQVLKGLSRQNAQKLVEMLKKGEKLPENVPDQIKQAYALGQAVLEDYINGNIRDPEAYEELLDMLIPIYN